MSTIICFDFTDHPLGMAIREGLQTFRESFPLCSPDSDIQWANRIIIPIITCSEDMDEADLNRLKEIINTLFQTHIATLQEKFKLEERVRHNAADPSVMINCLRNPIPFKNPFREDNLPYLTSLNDKVTGNILAPIQHTKDINHKIYSNNEDAFILRLNEGWLRDFLQDLPTAIEILKEDGEEHLLEETNEEDEGLYPHTIYKFKKTNHSGHYILTFKSSSIYLLLAKPPEEQAAFDETQIQYLNFSMHYILYKIMEHYEGIIDTPLPQIEVKHINLWQRTVASVLEMTTSPTRENEVVPPSSSLPSALKLVMETHANPSVDSPALCLMNELAALQQDPTQTISARITGIAPQKEEVAQCPQQGSTPAAVTEVEEGLVSMFTPREHHSTSFFKRAHTPELAIYGFENNEGGERFALSIRNEQIQIPTPNTIPVTLGETKHIYSPAGQVYQFHLSEQGIPTAQLTTHDYSVDNIHENQLRLAVTIINMIDNVLAHSNEVHVDTSDPFVANIANQYLDFLSQQYGICCPKSINAKSQYTQEEYTDDQDAMMKQLIPSIQENYRNNLALRSYSQRQARTPRYLRTPSTERHAISSHEISSDDENDSVQDKQLLGSTQRPVSTSPLSP